MSNAGKNGSEAFFSRRNFEGLALDGHKLFGADPNLCCVVWNPDPQKFPFPVPVEKIPNYGFVRGF